MAGESVFSGESKNVEYKVAVPDKSEKYLKTIVAFANTQGGQLVIGIDDKTRQVIGVDNEELFGIMDSMAIAQKITSMVLALRRKVNIKVRQPLQQIMIPAVDDEIGRASCRERV